MTQDVFSLGEDRMTLGRLSVVARGGRVSVPEAARRRMALSRRVVEEALLGPAPVYGVSTGFGHLAHTRIPPGDVAALQTHLVRSHAAGVGEPLGPHAVRATLALRAHALALGQSGVRPVVVESLAALLNRSVHPVVPREGSVGASGDLAPLAHIALTVMGEGEAYLDEAVDHPVPSVEALSARGLRPLSLTAKEGLALTNGSQLTAALGALALVRADRALGALDVAAALTLQALRGIPAAYDARLVALRPHPGAVRTAERMRALLEGSRLVTSVGELRVQDAYSLRAVPPVHGAARDAFAFAQKTLTIEMNAVTDNPLVVGAGDPDGAAVLSGANFHGAPLALVLDALAIGLGQVAVISERRTERLVNPALSGGLPPFLTSDAGLNSGLMVAQYTAAALVSAIKVLAHPASVDSIPTSAGQEDVVSMGPIAARKLLAIVEKLESIVAIELLSACQAADLVGREGLSPATVAAENAVRAEIPFLTGDRVLAYDMRTLAERVRDGTYVRAASACIPVSLSDLEEG